MTRRIAWAALAAIACSSVAAPVAGQFGYDGVSVLTLLPSSGSLSVGEEIEGRLGSDDYLYDGRRVQRYEFEGARGASVIIDLISRAFDAYMILIGPDGNEMEGDDDTGGACDARISTFLEGSGTFGIVVAGWGEGTGPFRLRLGDRQEPETPGDCGGVGAEALDVAAANEPDGTVSLDGASTVDGSLGVGDAQLEGGRADTWVLSGEPGTRVFVDLMSRAFDAKLIAVDPSGLDFSEDDDSGGACNARMEILLEQEPHTLIVVAYGAAGRGDYTIRVSAGEPPMASDACP